VSPQEAGFHFIPDEAFEVGVKLELISFKANFVSKKLKTKTG
jgi:hypothetical protein